MSLLLLLLLVVAVLWVLRALLWRGR